MGGTNRPGHSFILKIWLEHGPEDNERPAWRGHVTHVPDGDRRYVRSLADVADVLGPYLLRMGVNPGLAWRIRHWLKKKQPQRSAGETALEE